MNEHDLTSWFDGKVKPARPGVYMQMSGLDFSRRASLGYQYWDGKFWGSWSPSLQGAFFLRKEVADRPYQNDPWRGLSRKPSK